MSWDATFSVKGADQWHEMGDWNYTHNTSRMIYDVLGGREGPWYATLDGASGEEGGVYLNRIITGLEAEPEKFRAMNPENKWGSYDTLLPVLREMRAMSTEWPAGKWWASG